MNPVPTYDVVLPANDDPVVASAVERVGGAAGSHRGRLEGLWTPLRVLVLLTTLGYVVGYVSKLPCHAEQFQGDARYTRLCYSDIPYLFQLRGFADGFWPYLQAGPGQEHLEYPVLTGFFMQVAAMLTGNSGSVVDRSMRFYDWNVLLLFVCLLVTVVATALTVRRRPWDAALVALAPSVILCAVINWDLLAVALTSVSMLFWARSKVGWAGVLLGLAIAAKFYPVLLLGPLLFLCLRAGRMRAFAVTAGAAVLTWAVINVPIALIAPEGWSRFYTFSSTRGGDWGSFWYVLQVLGKPVPPERLNLIATSLLGVLCLGIAGLVMVSGRRPRYAQVAFLVVAAFCLTNKVYSPQYVLWIVPLAAMARPRWRDFLIWQVGEVAYFGAIWYFLQQYGNDNKGLPYGWYAFAIMLHIALTAWFAGVVVRDIVRPRNDPVRTDSEPEHRDDPGGGVLDFAPDRWSLSRTRYLGREGVGDDGDPDDPDGTALLAARGRHGAHTS
jgi:uncharacterized membrane protein